ncbi:MAG: DNA-processing protein DprA [Bacteroidota bacterium]
MNVRALLELSAIPGIGSGRLRMLVSHFGDPESVLRASAKELTQVDGINRKLASLIVHHEPNTQFVEEQLSRINKTNGKIVTFWDKEYPPLLKKIFDPPAILFMRGNLQQRDTHAIAIVGTRRPSSYGETMAEKFSRELASLGITIVSGLALGIDSIAHAAALKANGRTLAVIGSGVDIIYPSDNRKLAERIIERGAIISEFPMGEKPDSGNFPRRNRIISGMTLGTIIIESAEDGGAMITASTALDQNREVFAVPGSVLDKRSSGCHRLIKEGRAKLITSVDDVLAELEASLRPILKRRHGEEKRESPAAESLNLFERKLYDVLAEGTLHIDLIAEKAGMSTSDALVHLLSLEFKNMVRQLPGKMFSRVR